MSMKKTILLLGLLLIIVMGGFGCAGNAVYGAKLTFSWENAKSGDKFTVGVEPYVYFLGDDGSEKLKKDEKGSPGDKVPSVEKKKCVSHPQAPGFSCWIIASRHFVLDEKKGEYISRETFEKAKKV